MRTTFEDRLPMRAALAYYLNHGGPQSSGRGIIGDDPNAIKWPSGTGGNFMELDPSTLGVLVPTTRQWIVELCTHHERLGIYLVTWTSQEESESSDFSEWLVGEIDAFEVGEPMEIKDESIFN